MRENTEIVHNYVFIGRLKSLYQQKCDPATTPDRTTHNRKEYLPFSVDFNPAVTLRSFFFTLCQDFVPVSYQ